MPDDPLINLEDPAPPVPPVPAPPAVAPPPPAPVVAAPPVVPEPEPEEGVVELGGERLVPLAALQAERQQRKQLGERAALADRLEAQLNENRPYVEFLRNNPQLLQRQAPAPAAPQPPGPAPSDPRAMRIAQRLSLYTPDGKPDLESAQDVLAVAREIAVETSRQAVAPMVHQSMGAQSEANFRTVLTGLKDADGRPPTEQSLRAVWNAVGPQATSDLQVAGMLGLLAIGADRSLGGVKSPVAPPAQQPAFSESSGGQPRPRAVMTGLETQIATDRNIAPTKWQELTKGHQTGRPSVLEE